MKKLKQYLLTQLNSYVLELFDSVKNDSDWSEFPDVIEKVSKTYLKDYFKEDMELEAISEKGRQIVSIVIELKNKNPIFAKLYKETKVWSKYRDVIRAKTYKDIFSMSKSEANEYNIIFAQYLDRTIVGSNISGAEVALRITQRDDFDLQRTRALDFLVLQYASQKNNKNIQIKNEDEVISILLEYEVQLKK